MNKETNQIEDLFKQAFENYEADAGSNAWQAIQSKMAAESAATSSASAASTTTTATSTSWIATAIVATVISATAIGGYFFFNDTAEKIKGKDKPFEVKEKIEFNKKENTSTQTEISSSTNTNKDNALKTENNVEEVVADKEINEKTTNLSSNVNNSKSESTKATVVENQEANNKLENKQSNDNLTNNNTATVEKNVSEELTTTETADISETTKPNNNTADKKVEEKSTTTPPSQTTSTEAEVNEETNKEKVSPPTFINLPNVFSPNNDGVNDELKMEIEDFDEYHIQIFNRSGQMVFESHDINNHWKGDLPNGSIAPVGYYSYQILILKEGESFKKVGSVFLSANR